MIIEIDKNNIYPAAEEVQKNLLKKATIKRTVPDWGGGTKQVSEEARPLHFKYKSGTELSGQPVLQIVLLGVTAREFDFKDLDSFEFQS
ncbi:hypothetical protein PP657_gp114 [Bacillus phage BCPST]|uniref:Uncharacterized protein n=1 Tax=Bacillus phage BCPST TaxID=2801506 RepID=A0AAE7P5P4_9CAUD|nr:hypothetical protein PP657_gp114 [Bacillus phage BCPST]QQO38708.1 hypothetical protein BCPST_090 [Bacillus phage BCPST]QSJ04299.1 hypothetical protein BCP6_095 [Bacillus phage BCP6]